MALLRLIALVCLYIYSFSLNATTLKYSPYRIGISLSKPAAFLFNSNIKNEFFFRKSISNKPLAFQSSFGYEIVNRQTMYDNKIEGAYLRTGVIFRLVDEPKILKKPLHFHIGGNLLVNHYRHNLQEKPEGQLANDYYFKKFVITQSVFAEAEVGVILFHSKNSKWRLEVINRAGIAIIKPRLNYYTNIRPGINKYNMNRLYATGGSICLFFKI